MMSGMPTQERTQTFDISPLGPYSLEESARFIDAWHQAPAEGGSASGHLHLAFLTDREWEPVGVCVTQDGAGAVRSEIYGSAATPNVKNQVARVLSLDIDGRGWPEVGVRDRVVASLQRRFPGSRTRGWA